MNVFFAVQNPYREVWFGEFFLVFFKRMFLLMTGALSFEDLVPDEIQALVLMGVAISSSLVGTFLVLRRMTMLANSLSHTILVGIVLAYYFSSTQPASMESLLVAAFFTGLATTFLTQFLTKSGGLQEDASTGLVFTSLFALGVLLVSLLTRNAHIGIEAVMGNADALHPTDFFWVACVICVNVLLIVIFYKEYKLTTFDSALAKALGFSPLFFNYLLMSQVSVTTMTSFRAVGVLLVLALMTGPVLAARVLTHSLVKLLILSATLGMGSALAGVALSRHLLNAHGLALSTSGLVVCAVLVMFAGVMSYELFNRQRARSRAS